MLHIITHPLIGNFGGVLQAYALQHAINSVGFEAKVCETIPDFARNEYYSPGKRLKWLQLKECTKLTLGRMSYVPSFLKRKRVKCFKERFMIMSDKNDIKREDTFIVGSDQVWRLQYTRTYGDAKHFFLDFATKAQRQRSIAYAASFGTDEWEGSPEETASCRELLNDFKAISVREQSGISLCHDVFGVQAVQMPDPTLLLPAEEYGTLIKKSHTWHPAKQYMAAYVLDPSPEKQRLLQETAHGQGLYLQELMPHVNAEKIRDRFPMSPPQWLRSIRDCECLVTDSFHGCVFSIIFNRPFVCLGNAERGSSRFDTLLSTFGLEERILTTPTPQTVARLLATPIDWEKVNEKIAAERARGLLFLQQHLPLMQ